MNTKIIEGVLDMYTIYGEKHVDIEDQDRNEHTMYDLLKDLNGKKVKITVEYVEKEE